MPLSLEFEQALWNQGVLRVAGVDEAGRGPLAGPVVAAAVVFAPGCTPLTRVNDSKKLSPETREALFDEIRACSRYAVAEVSHEEIDRINILQAALKAMRLAIEALPEPAEHLLIDGNKRVALPLPQQSLVKGDGRCYSIAAASILAKVHRDRLMREIDRRYPEYGFAAHKGYPTAAHREAIKRHGPCPIHRRTFGGVREFLR